MYRFPDGARVCFVGDSITCIGLYLKYIVAQYRNDFPDSHVEFYNCGISGGNLGNTIRIFDEDISIYEPTHIVLMTGANDSRRWALANLPSAEHYEILQTAYERYRENLVCFYRLTCERDITLILCTPMPYAEYISSPIEPLRGGAKLFAVYAEVVRQIAKEQGIPLCDYHAAMEAKDLQTLYNPDRVHPTEKGHALMAKTFLDFQGISMKDWDEIPSDIEQWHEVTQKLRSIITAEFLCIPTYADMTHEERRVAMADRQRQAQANPEAFDPVARFRVDSYQEHKPKQAQYIEQVKQFMKR